MGQSCVKGAISAAHRKGRGVRFPHPDKAADGNVSEPGDAGDGPGESSLFSFDGPEGPGFQSMGDRAQRPVKHRTSAVSGAPSTALENPGERFRPCRVVLITASGLQGEQPLVDRTM